MNIPTRSREAASDEFRARGIGRANVIRVAHLVRCLDLGGLEIVVYNLVRFADPSVVAPCVICIGDPGVLSPRFEAIGVPVVALGVEGFGLSHRVWRIAKELRRLRPDVLHTHNVAPHLNGALARCLTSVPRLVHTKHGRNQPDQYGIVRRNWFASLLSSCVVAVSADAADVAQRTEGVPKHRVRVIRNGICTRQFIPPDSARQGPMHRAVHVARLDPIKDQVTLIRATRRVVDVIPEFTLDIVGDGTAREQIEAEITRLHLHTHVTLRGMQDNVVQYYQNADLFVLSSISEGISLTVAEAMACELPVIATDVGGNRELVQVGRTGVLVPSQNPEALADAIIDSCRNPNRTRAMGRAARTRIVAEFSLDSMVSQYETLYRSLLGRGQP